MDLKDLKRRLAKSLIAIYTRIKNISREMKRDVGIAMGTVETGFT
jgi:hypothetical protein